MGWWLGLWCASIRSWVQSLMDVHINVFYTNVVYKHVHHGEWRQNLFVDKIVKQNKTKPLIFFHDML
jgi:hypothetical protein